MSGTCGTVVAFAGRSDFNSLLPEIIGVSLIKDGNTFTDATFITESTWKTLISASAGMLALPLSLKRGFENTTPEVTFETSNLGFSEQTTQPIPSIKGYLDGSYCDYKTYMELNGQSFNVVLHLKDGSQFATRDTSLVVKGFKATVHTYFGVSQAENRMQSYPLWVNFESYDEFMDGYLDNPTYTFRDLLDYVPIALNIKVVTAYAAGVVVVKVTNRATGAGFEGLILTDWVELAANTDDTQITAMTDDLSGQYSLTIKSDAGGTPDNLTTGQYLEFQAQEITGGYITYATHKIRVTA